jgi:hypothetical protein
MWKLKASSDNKYLTGVLRGVRRRRRKQKSFTNFVTNVEDVLEATNVHSDMFFGLPLTGGFGAVLAKSLICLHGEELRRSTGCDLDCENRSISSRASVISWEHGSRNIESYSSSSVTAELGGTGQKLDEISHEPECISRRRTSKEKPPPLYPALPESRQRIHRAQSRRFRPQTRVAFPRWNGGDKGFYDRKNASFNGLRASKEICPELFERCNEVVVRQKCV